MTDRGEAAAPVRCFFSYARMDDDAFDIVKPLKTLLTATYHAKTGRRLDIFLDREAIGWGEDWRDKIGESVESALLFVPIITARYFERVACRDELLAFYGQCKMRKVTALILPIVLMGHGFIRADSSDELVRIVERIQYRPFEEAWLAGQNSPQWRTAVFALADDLQNAVARAESKLAPVEPDPARPRGRRPKPTSARELTVLPDITVADLLTEFKICVDQMARDVEEFEPAMDGLGVVLSGLESLRTTEPKFAAGRLAFFAKQIAKPAAILERTGREFTTDASRADTVLRRALATDGVGSVAGTHIASTLAEMNMHLANVFETNVLLSDLLERSRQFEVLSVPLRTALRPARQGIASIRDAIAIVLSWRSLQVRPPAGQRRRASYSG